MVCVPASEANSYLFPDWLTNYFNFLLYGLLKVFSVCFTKCLIYLFIYV